VADAFSNYVACRFSATELLRTVGPQMHLRIDKLSRHARTLTDTDPTWILDEGWLQQHGQSVLQNSWHAAVLACLPSQALGKDYDQASLVYGTIII
jgi:hypothetical protein